MDNRKAIITGAGGTVGPALTHHLEQAGWDVMAWDRTAVSHTDPPDMHSYLQHEFPDALFHLATASRPTGMENESWIVNVAWTENLASICRQLGIKFLFTSSVMVFSDNAAGPFTPAAEPDAAEGYGYEKREAEKRVYTHNPGAVIARLGWQIGEAPGSNNMIDFLHRQMAEKGQIRATTRWYPAASFLEDTAATLAELAQNGRGLFQVDSNRRWSFFEIVTALNEKHGRPWQIVPTDDFVFDQRMLDERVRIPSLQEKLPSLP